MILVYKVKNNLNKTDRSLSINEHSNLAELAK